MVWVCHAYCVTFAFDIYFMFFISDLKDIIFFQIDHDLEKNHVHLHYNIKLLHITIIIKLSNMEHLHYTINLFL